MSTFPHQKYTKLIPITYVISLTVKSDCTQNCVHQQINVFHKTHYYKNSTTHGPYPHLTYAGGSFYIYQNDHESCEVQHIIKGWWRFHRQSGRCQSQVFFQVWRHPGRRCQKATRILNKENHVNGPAHECHLLAQSPADAARKARAESWCACMLT